MNKRSKTLRILNINSFWKFNQVINIYKLYILPLAEYAISQIKFSFNLINEIDKTIRNSIKNLLNIGNGNIELIQILFNIPTS